MRRKGDARPTQNAPRASFLRAGCDARNVMSSRSSLGLGDPSILLVGRRRDENVVGIIISVTYSEVVSVVA